MAQSMERYENLRSAGECRTVTGWAEARRYEWNIHPSSAPRDHAEWRADRMGKSTLFESSRLLVGLNAFEPGQAHALHAHAGMDKVYQVLEGDGRLPARGARAAHEGWRPAGGARRACRTACETPARAAARPGDPRTRTRVTLEHFSHPRAAESRRRGAYFNGSRAGQLKPASRDHYQKPVAPNPISRFAADGMDALGMTR